MNLQEKNLRAGTLKYLVDPVVDIDMYTPKIQQDSVVVVVRIADSYDAGYDFSSFVEKLPFGILDTEVQEIPNTDGSYEVFIEMERNAEFPDNLVRILTDASSLCAEPDTTYVWRANVYGHESNEPVDLDADVIRGMVRLVPEKQIREFFEYSLDKVVVGETIYIGEAEFGNCRFISESAAAQCLSGATELPHRLGKYYEAYAVNDGVLITRENKCLLLRNM